MLHFSRTLQRLCLGLMLVAVLAGCGAGAAPVGPGGPGTGLSIGADGCPSSVVKTGDTVTWTNAAAADRQVRLVRDTVAIFDSGILKPGDSTSYVFAEEGQFPYTCSLDGTLTGTITVEP